MTREETRRAIDELYPDELVSSAPRTTPIHPVGVCPACGYCPYCGRVREPHIGNPSPFNPFWEYTTGTNWQPDTFTLGKANTSYNGEPASCTLTLDNSVANAQSATSFVSNLCHI